MFNLKKGTQNESMNESEQILLVNKLKTGNFHTGIWAYNFKICVYRPIIYGHQGGSINMRSIEMAYECALAFYFHLWIHDHTYSVYREQRYWLHILQDICQWRSGSDPLPSSCQSSLTSSSCDAAALAVWSRADAFS